MIIGLYKLLNEIVVRRVFGFRRITTTHIIFLGVAFLFFRGQISMGGIAVILIPTILLSTGVFIPPYAYLINIFKLKINTRIFKKSIYIYCSKHGNVRLRKKNSSWEIEEPIGLIVEDKIYMKKPETFYNEPPILWGFKDKINYIEDFEEFEKELKDDDDLETIKRKIILNNLGN